MKRTIKKFKLDPCIHYFDQKNCVKNSKYLAYAYDILIIIIIIIIFIANKTLAGKAIQYNTTLQKYTLDVYCDILANLD
jgi:hypothetical protein